MRRICDSRVCAVNLTMGGVLMESLSWPSKPGDGFPICNGLDGNDRDFEGCDGSLIVEGFFAQSNIVVKMVFGGQQNALKTAKLLSKGLKARQHIESFLRVFKQFTLILLRG